MNLPANNSWKSRFMRIYQVLLKAFELRNKKMDKKKKKKIEMNK